MSGIGNIFSNQWGALTHPFNENYYNLNNSFSTSDPNAGATSAALGSNLGDGSGQPTPPGYVPAYDPSTMSLTASSNPFLAQLDSDAMSTGPSKIANLETTESNRQGLMARDNNAQTAGGNAAKADSDLAASGGLSSGARERVQMNANNDVLNLNQKSNQQVQANDAQIGINDAQNRLSELSTAANTANSQNEFNIGNEITAGNSLNAYNQNLFAQNASMYGANQTAQAQIAAANKPSGTSFICTALREAGLMSTRETVQMTSFMLKSILTRADFFAWYFTRGKEATKLAKIQGFDFSAGDFKKRMVDQILSCEREFGAPSAQSLYIMRTGEFCTQVLGECGYKSTMAEVGIAKSLLALPKVFLLPQTWVWLRGYFGAKIDRKISKLSRKWSTT